MVLIITAKITIITSSSAWFWSSSSSMARRDRLLLRAAIKKAALEKIKKSAYREEISIQALSHVTSSSQFLCELWYFELPAPGLSLSQKTDEHCTRGSYLCCDWFNLDKLDLAWKFTQTCQQNCMTKYLQLWKILNSKAPLFWEKQIDFCHWIF